ncbi:hypothetical protein BASA82_000576 [Batrachochytrium salamandrivorans]|nr:hypothetical protein BASA81_003956 [Batrachochytrium salamandrivorans]KAH9262373.1 hypothetical protein BASA82_000576 [Batrachochytrium salamandrivorans]
MFSLDLSYDEISNKARMDTCVRVVLERLFKPTGRLYTERFLRIANDTRSNAARSTAYVLSQGHIDSPKCFSYSKFKRAKSVWITPNGWKVATIACSIIFVGETKVINGRMQYRFALGNLPSVVGEWSVNIQAAFAHLEPHLTERSRTTLSKLSKEIILGVHTDRVQALVRAQWHKGKLAMSKDLQQAAMEMESRPQLDDYDPDTSAVVVSKRARLTTTCVLVDPPSNPLGVLTVLELATVLSQVMARPLLPGVLESVLHLLEAGEGCTLDCLVRFLCQVEVCVRSVWEMLSRPNQLQCYWASAKEDGRLNACVFVFGLLMDKYPAELPDSFTTPDMLYYELTGLPLPITICQGFAKLFPL